MVEPSATDAELERLTRAGIRGIRFHMFRGGVLPWSSLDGMAARVHAFGWHVQLQLDGRELADREATIRALPGRFVIDHVGKFLQPVGVDHPGFRALTRLLDTGRCWVKLSAPYETSKVGPPTFADVGVLARALVAHAPERMLWASNWPHPPLCSLDAPVRLARQVCELGDHPEKRGTSSFAMRRMVPSLSGTIG